ncbi:MAG: zinc ribbon domain-containing protein [Candidatus Rifleibacteriota bacterium]
MKKNIMFSSNLVKIFFCIIAFSLISSLLSAQEAFKVPGKLFSNYGKGQKLKLDVTKIGDYNFSLKNPDRKINKDNMMTGKDFRNAVKMEIFDINNKKIASNYFSGVKVRKSEMGNMKSRHLYSFNASFKATGTCYLKLTPLNKDEEDRKYLLEAKYKGRPFLIWGMKWDEFLTMAAGIVAFLFIGFIVFLILLSGRRQLQQKAEEEAKSPPYEIDDEFEVKTDAKGLKPSDSQDAPSQADETEAKSTIERFCPSCGTAREEKADFCANCGHKFKT